MTTTEQPAEKLDFKRILPIIAIVFVDLLGLSIIIPLLPLYAARFSATPLIIGTLQAAYPLMQFLGAPFLGRLSDRFGRKPILVISQVGTFGGYEQLFSLFTLRRPGMDARDTSGLFVIAGLFIVIVQGGFVGRWSKQRGDRWLVILGVSTLAVGLIGTALTPAIPIPWYDRSRVLAGLAGEGAIRVSIQDIQIQLPDQSARGGLGIIWLRIASFPAALGGGVLQPAVNSLITKSSDKNEVGGMLGISAGFYSAANAVAPLFYRSLFQWFGAPVPFLAGGLILLILCLFAPRVIPK